MLDREFLREKYGEEMVLVAKRGDYQPMTSGFIPVAGNSTNFLRHMLPDNAFYMLRHDAEQNPAVRQIIPYAYITRTVDDETMFFATTRLPSDDSEERLHDKISLGIGGHINPEDDSEDIFNTIHLGLVRDLFEEVDMLGVREEGIVLNFMGVINDCSTNVSKDHIGYVFNIHFDYAVSVGIKENHKMVGRFIDESEVEKHYYDLESWSQILAGYLFKGGK